MIIIREINQKTVVEAVWRRHPASKHKEAGGWKVLLESCKLFHQEGLLSWGVS